MSFSRTVLFSDVRVNELMVAYKAKKRSSTAPKRYAPPLLSRSSSIKTSMSKPSRQCGAAGRVGASSDSGGADDRANRIDPLLRVTLLDEIVEAKDLANRRGAFVRIE